MLCGNCSPCQDMQLMHTTRSEHAGTLGCAAAIGRSNTCVVQQQYSKAVSIHQTSANVCRKALKGFIRLGPKHRDLSPSLNTCCNYLLIPHHSATCFETGKPLEKLMSSRSRSTCPCYSQTSMPAAGFCMYAWAKPQ